MAADDIKLTALPPVTTPEETDLLYLVKGTTSYSVILSQLSTLWDLDKIALNETKADDNASAIATLQANETTKDASISALNIEVYGVDDNTTDPSRIDTLVTELDIAEADVLVNEVAIADITAGDVAYDKTTYNPVDVSTLTEGQVAYDQVTRTLVVKSDIPDQTLNVGQETLIRVYNPSGGTFLNGQVVKQIGVQNGVPSIDLAQADSFSNAKTLGILTQDIAAGAEGYTTAFGNVADAPVNQDGETWNIGDTIYLSAVTAGGLTNVIPPVASIIGRIMTSNGVTGNIFAAPRNLITLPPVGGWLKLIPTTIAPVAGYTQFSGFTDVSSSYGLQLDGVVGSFIYDIQGTYESSLSVSFTNITAETNGSVITIQLYNSTQDISLFEYNVIVGRNDTVASGTLITQFDVLANDLIVARYKETSGNVGNGVSLQNISFVTKSILIR